MVTLAFDTSAKVATVAVLDGEKALASYSINNGLTQSELIMPMAENMLSALSLSISDVGLFTCSVGPGSFTGVRIGVSLIKGLAFGRDVGVVGVSTLEALADNLFGTDGIVAAVMDARRGEVYTAVFDSNSDGMKRICEDKAIPISELAQILGQYPDKKIYLVGDGYSVAHKALTDIGIKLECTPPILRDENAVSVGRCAYRKFTSGEVITDRELAPVYLRMPQAERERLMREQNNT